MAGKKGKDFFVSMGKWKYAWSTRSGAYDGIAASLGVKEVGASEQDVVYGANYPKPPQVRISYIIGTGANAKVQSVTRFCSPDKIKDVLNGSLRGKTIEVDEKSYRIDSVSLA